MSHESVAFRILIAVLAIGCALGLIHVVSAIGFHVAFDPNEGWNAVFAQSVLSSGSPYPKPSDLLFNNYPPLSFYVVAAVSKLTGDAIVAGRIVALTAFLAVAFGMERAAVAMGCTRPQALFAALLFATGLMLTSDYVGMDDPQLLGHAIAMGGLLLALREPRTPRLMVGAALCLALAFFVKHNLIVLPLALGGWLSLADRRHATPFIVSGIVFLLLGLGLFKQVYGFSLLSQIDSARSYSFANIASALALWLPWGTISAAGAALLLVVARHDRHAVLCVLYAGLAIGLGIYFSGGAGVDANAMFDADIALALCAGLLINRLQIPVWKAVAASLCAIPLVIGVWSLDPAWRDGDFWLHPMADDRRTAAAEIALLHAAKGPALCEMLSLCYWAGKPAQVDVFNLEQAYLTGTRRDVPLIRSIQERRYAMIQLEQMTPFPLTADIHAALLKNYRIVRTDDDRVFFVPR